LSRFTKAIINANINIPEFVIQDEASMRNHIRENKNYYDHDWMMMTMMMMMMMMILGTNILCG